MSLINCTELAQASPTFISCQTHAHLHTSLPCSTVYTGLTCLTMGKFYYGGGNKKIKKIVGPFFS